jgi:hypothetical protein
MLHSANSLDHKAFVPQQSKKDTELLTFTPAKQLLQEYYKSMKIT